MGGGKTLRRGGALYATDPVALCVDRYYYLVAYDRELGDYRHYRLDRMENLTVTDEPRGNLPEGFDLGTYVQTRFNMFKGETVTVTVRFAAKLLNAVTDRFGTEAHLRRDGEDAFLLTAPVEKGPTFWGWLFTFGPEAELLEPASARAEYAAWCRDTLAQYGE